MTKKQKRNLKKILLAAILFFILIILGQISKRTGLFSPVFGSRWISMIFYLVPYLIVGWPVLKKAALGIKNRQVFDESFLMTLATFGAFATGENPEAVGVMLFYQVGELFQDYAVNRSRRSIKELMDIAPEYANLMQPDGTTKTIDPEEIRIGNILLVRPGEKVPVDGIVTQGEGFLNTSALTGESVPRKVRPKDAIISGCINQDTTIEFRAEKSYEDSTVAQILELVENASSKKSKTEQFITRFARYYTPAVVIAALVLAFVPPLFTGHLLTWIYRACTFLVISCPCALVISVPLSFFGGIGAASIAGILVKGSNYLELAAKIDTLAMDKTGTLTRGEFSVQKLLPADGVTEDELLSLAALAESRSTHPIGRSICEAAEKKESIFYPTVSQIQIQDVPGKGLKANVVLSSLPPQADIDNSADKIQPSDDCQTDEAQQLPLSNDRKTDAMLQMQPSDDRKMPDANADSTYCHLLLGNTQLMAENEIKIPPIAADDATVIYLAKDSDYLGCILISDRIKEEAPDAIKALKASGVRQVVMLSGDRADVCKSVGQTLHLDRVYPELMPADKVARIEELLSSGSSEKSNSDRIVAFLGDGINDAPVLGRADVGIAMGSMGSDAAIEAADIVIMDDNLARLPRLVSIARKTVRISKQNIVFALAVKLLILLLGALGAANMWAAVFADVGVAVICILNSMRTLLAGKE